MPRLNLPQFIQNLGREAAGARPHGPPEPLDPALARLRAFQSARLAADYADLLESPRFGAAARYFLSEVYAARDFSQRDRDLARFHELLTRLLPAEMLALLADGVRLNRLSADLDATLLARLQADFGFPDPLPLAVYDAAYRACDNRAAREEQLDLLERVLTEVGEGARLPLVGAALRLAAVPARRAGWEELHGYLWRGREAFAPLGAATGEFVGRIVGGERARLARVYF
jgi:hypothetical protein